MERVPAEIFTSIQIQAKEAWPDDDEMQSDYIEAEIGGYLAIADVNFGAALPFKDQIIEEAMMFSELWEERATFVVDEVEAYAELLEKPEDVPVSIFEDLKSKAAADQNWFSLQRDEVARGVQHFYRVRDIRARIAPIRDLIIRMESIIGDECYNANIQNYGAWGVWEGEGRSFRYPVTVLRNGCAEKRQTRFDDLEPEELITGHYRFGANQLNIYRALVKVIEMLESDYGLKVLRNKG